MTPKQEFELLTALHQLVDTNKKLVALVEKQNALVTKLVEEAKGQRDEAVRSVVWPCPECHQGKHTNCDGTTWDWDNDAYAWCPCTDLYHAVKPKGETNG